MVIIRPALCISGCAQGSSGLSYRQVAARDYRVPEGINRHSVMVANLGLGDVPLLGAVLACSLEATPPNLTKVSLDPDSDPNEEPFIHGSAIRFLEATVARWLLRRRAVASPTSRRCPTRYLAPANSTVPRR